MPGRDVINEATLPPGEEISQTSKASLRAHVCSKVLNIDPFSILIEENLPSAPAKTTRLPGPGGTAAGSCAANKGGSTAARSFRQGSGDKIVHKQS
jgi:hypothetical protein